MSRCHCIDLSLHISAQYKTLTGTIVVLTAEIIEERNCEKFFE
ncbi:hypothetical protein BGP_1352 [Beggiatoa sp. PS]|nr:hypothetical protein BGP_1352 [Beggiatoa sp. PS]